MKRLFVIVLLIGCSFVVARDSRQVGASANEVGRIESSDVLESSGLVAGQRNAEVLWTHNDSGDAARIYALGQDGADLGTYQLRGVRPVDWEDMAAFELDGGDYLLIADVGDNLNRRRHCTLYIVEEPRVAGTGNGDDPRRRATPLRVERTIRFNYEDGPHDCEAVAVDEQSGTVLLLQKVLLGAAGLYELKLPHERGVATARRVGQLWINAATGMDISPDGRRLVVGTYGPAYEFEREDGESWASAMQREPRRIALPDRRQSEGICYGPRGESIFLTSEGRHQPLWRVPVGTNAEP